MSYYLVAKFCSSIYLFHNEYMYHNENLDIILGSVVRPTGIGMKYTKGPDTFWLSVRFYWFIFHHKTADHQQNKKVYFYYSRLGWQLTSYCSKRTVCSLLTKILSTDSGEIFLTTSVICSQLNENTTWNPA